MGIGTGRPGIEDELCELGMPVLPPRERLATVRETVARLRDLDGPHAHTAPFMASARDTDPAALRAADSLAVLPDDPAAAAEEVQRRREEIGYSYFVLGAGSADVLAPMVTKLAGQ